MIHRAKPHGRIEPPPIPPKHPHLHPKSLELVSVVALRDLRIRDGAPRGFPGSGTGLGKGMNIRSKPASSLIHIANQSASLLFTRLVFSVIFFKMAEGEPVLGSLYVYAPNQVAPILFAIAFACSAVGHFWQC